MELRASLRRFFSQNQPKPKGAVFVAQHVATHGEQQQQFEFRLDRVEASSRPVSRRWSIPPGRESSPPAALTTSSIMAIRGTLFGKIKSSIPQPRAVAISESMNH
jgi:hypothetical protein